MNLMRTALHHDHDERWLISIFAAQAAAKGGIVRRSVADVEKRIGRKALELEVRRRGFHMAECGGQFVIICDRAPVRLIC
jgi:hypothetical protein